MTMVIYLLPNDHKKIPFKMLEIGTKQTPKLANEFVDLNSLLEA